MEAFVQTQTILDKILAQKVRELPVKADYSTLYDSTLHRAEAMPPARDFAGALRRDKVALIAEVKKASPSKGVLIENFEPVQIARTYAENSASALSILTDEQFFQGHLNYLSAVRSAVNLPALRKDFIIDAYQVVEARAAGADAVLLIVAALRDEQLVHLRTLIESLGMSALVEVHTEDELHRAIATGASLIGVNNRDLHSFQVDLATTERLAQFLPTGATLVAESGIFSVDDVQRMAECGAHAILVGESLVKAPNMPEQVRQLASVPRKAEA